MSFNRRWVKPPTNEGVANKILENKFIDNIKPTTPLKTKIEDAQKKLQLQISKLDGISNKMQKILSKSHYLFQKFTRILDFSGLLLNQE